MTSKEALNQLYILADTPEQAMVTQSYYNIVEKDLEILEILKKYLHIRNGTWSNIITCNIDSLTNEYYEIIQEWLEDETDK